jgi:hypothetical protein
VPQQYLANVAKTSDVSQRKLFQTLALRGLRSVDAGGEGNCLFRAAALILFNDAKRHQEVRDAVINEVRTNPERYEGFLAENKEGHFSSVQEYVAGMAKSHEWGDNIALSALSMAYHRSVVVLIDGAFSSLQYNPALAWSSAKVMVLVYQDHHYTATAPLSVWHTHIHTHHKHTTYTHTQTRTHSYTHTNSLPRTLSHTLQSHSNRMFPF